MEATTGAPREIDLAPRSEHPFLALLLGVLALPGSTVAWELPLGGLWIGLPLAVAAIVLGVRARRVRSDGGARVAAMIGIVLAALSIFQMAVYSVVSAVS